MAERPTAAEMLFHPFVLMKNPKAMQESIEAAKLMQSHISLKSSIMQSQTLGFGGPKQKELFYPAP